MFHLPLTNTLIMTRPILATIHSSALQHNYQQVKNRTPNSRAFAVIKANAYGHGLLRVAQALNNADGYALLEMEQAILLRSQGFEQPILLLEGVFSAEQLKLCAQYRLSIAIHDVLHLAWLQQTLLERPLHIYLKLNTGMNRLGFAAEQAPELVQKLQSIANVASVSLMMHFATADEADKGIDWQLTRFRRATEGLNLPVTLANSAALIDHPEIAGDWVRPGLMLYGASPFVERSAADLGLQAAMSLTSSIIGTQTLAVGDRVGYGATFCAEKPMRIGIVACGYADGYPRHAPTGTPVWVHGQRSRLVGRISMDMLAIDLSGIDHATLGSPVELWGKHLSIDEVANAAGTISYELMCAIAQRVPVLAD